MTITVIVVERNNIENWVWSRWRARKFLWETRGYTRSVPNGRRWRNEPVAPWGRGDGSAGTSVLEGKKIYVLIYIHIYHLLYVYTRPIGFVLCVRALYCTHEYYRGFPSLHTLAIPTLLGSGDKTPILWWIGLYGLWGNVVVGEHRAHPRSIYERV